MYADMATVIYSIADGERDSRPEGKDGAGRQTLKHGLFPFI
jgi:hypothetical protein